MNAGWRRNRGAVFVALALCGAPAAPCLAAGGGDPELRMTAADAVTTAVRNNKDIRIQEKELKAARAKRLGAVSDFLPKLEADGAYTRNEATLGGDIPFPIQSDKDIGVFTGYQNDIRTGLVATQRLFSGGGRTAALGKAGVELRIQEERLRALKLDVEFEAERLYYGLLLAVENERIAQECVTQARAHYEDVARKFSQGTASRFDLLQSKVHVSLLLPQLVQAANAIELLDAELKKLLSLDLGERLVPEDRLAFSPIEIDEEAFRARAMAERPELILRALGVDAGAFSVRQARAGRFPTVDAAFNDYFRSNSSGTLFSAKHNLWNAGVAVAVPLFDGFAVKAKVDEAWARYAQANLSRENAIEQTAVDVRRACLDIRESAQIVESQRDNILEAREALRLSEVRYDNGVGTNLDVLDAMTSLSQAEGYYASGVYDHLMAKSSLHRTMGESVLTEE